jgi:5-methylcytosine-specific restriction endonuclease McrA
MSAQTMEHKHTEYSKLKMSISHTGKVGYWRGKKMSEATKEKMRKSQLKRVLIHNKKGWKHSEETIKKMVIARKNYWNSLTNEERKQISLSRMGRLFSEETKQKLRGRKGILANNWRGGVTPQNKLERGSSQYKEWRNLVFKRDNYTCVDCGHKGRGLEAHHILSFSKHIELRYVVSNGITYCKKCHAKNDPIRNRSFNKELPQL